MVLCFQLNALWDVEEEHLGIDLLRLPGAGVGLVARSLTGSEEKLSVNEVGLNRKFGIVLRCSLGRNHNSAFYYPLVVEPPEVKTGHQ